MCNKDGNTNKCCYLTSDTHLGIVSVTDHTGYLFMTIKTSL